MNKLILLALLALFIPAAQAATLEGTVFDFSLDAIDKALVTINTTPEQRSVTQNGMYRFELPQGQYQVTAMILKQGVITAQANEQIDLPENGTFTVDIIMFPELLDDLEPITKPEVIEEGLFEEPQDQYFFVNRALWVLLIVIVIWGGYKWSQRQVKIKTDKLIKEKDKIKNETPETMAADLEDIISLIKKNGGRMTQKQLRKHISHSEAKVSLMIHDLESQGKIKKIKKGRGNIIILK